MKIRGTAHHIGEKYLQLARDAHSSGDPVRAESYLQHAEHYFRVIAAAQQAQNSYGRPFGDAVDADDDEDDDSLPDRFASPSDRQVQAPFGERQPFQPHQHHGGQGYQGGQAYQGGQGHQGGQGQQGGDRAGHGHAQGDRVQENRGDNRNDRSYDNRSGHDRGFQDRGYQDRGYQDRGYQDRGQQDRSQQDRGHQGGHSGAGQGHTGQFGNQAGNAQQGGQAAAHATGQAAGQATGHATTHATTHAAGHERGGFRGEGGQQDRPYGQDRQPRHEQAGRDQPRDFDNRQRGPRPPRPAAEPRQLPAEEPVNGLPAFITAPTRIVAEPAPIPSEDAGRSEDRGAEHGAASSGTGEEIVHLRPRRRRRPKSEFAEKGEFRGELGQEAPSKEAVASDPVID